MAIDTRPPGACMPAMAMDMEVADLADQACQLHKGKGSFYRHSACVVANAAALPSNTPGQCAACQAQAGTLC